MIDQFRDQFFFLSNFYPCDIYYKGKLFPTSEHAYQSQKSFDENWVRTCVDYSISPGKIKSLSKNLDIRVDWDSVKMDIMYEILRIKFSCDPLKSLLLDTNPHKLIEGNFHGDKFCGVCLKTNKGKNNLGKILMSIRFDLEFN